MQELLKCNHLYTTFQSRNGDVKAVCDATFSIKQGEIVALIGETGCGKSVLGQTILQLLPSSARIKGEILFEGTNLAELNPKEIRNYRGKKIAYINQNPTEALNPVLTVGTQIVESIRLCEKISKKEARKKAEQILSTFSFQNPEEIMKKYPIELSGGMKQRVLTAMAMGGNPPLLIADEPTKGLDALIRGQVIETLQKFINYTGCAGLIITHDLKFARAISNRIMLMYAGEIVESGTTEEMLNHPQHPYLQALIASMPSNGLHILEGQTCSLIELPEGCRFASRCPYASEECRVKHPEMAEISEDHLVRCTRYA